MGTKFADSFEKQRTLLKVDMNDQQRKVTLRTKCFIELPQTALMTSSPKIPQTLNP